MKDHELPNSDVTGYGRRSNPGIGSGTSGNSEADNELSVAEIQEHGNAVTRAAIYGRISGERQKTIAAQILLGRQRCQERGWNVSFILSDEGLSGADSTRPGFQRLMDLAEEGRIDVVVTWKIDRLARSLAHAAALEELLRENGVAIHSCTEPIDTTTSSGRFVFGILANAAQLERDLIRERTRMGLHYHAQQGRWARPRVPFGYRRTKGMKLRIHPDEARTVCAVFETYLARGSMNETAHALNLAGATFRGKKWTQERVRMIIDNRIYVGEFNVSDVKKHLKELSIVALETAESVWALRTAATRSGVPASETARLASIDAVFKQYVASLDALAEGEA